MVIRSNSKSKSNYLNNIKDTFHIYFSKYNKTLTGFAKRNNIKLTLVKVIAFIIIFIIIFDKATIFLVLYLFNKFIILPSKTENYSNALVSTVYEPSNNNIHLLSSVFKHPELNLKSYTNVKIDPTKVMFEDNKFLPECCLYNSDYSSSKGCSCITKEQQYYLIGRGTNKSSDSSIDSNQDPDTDYKNIYFSPTLAFQGESVPFKANDENYIIGYEPLTIEKKNAFNNLINMY